MIVATLSILAILSAVLTVVTSIAAWTLHAKSRRLPWGSSPISILKPVRGLDDELEVNLESFCRQTHPRYEIIVGAADPDDPALGVARRVRARYPHVAFRIVSGQWSSGCNPKVRNLRNLLTCARYSTILVSDGDVRVDPEYLSVMAGAIEQPNVGLVSNLIVGQGERTLGAACENAQFNGFIAASTAAATLIARHPVVVGKSMLFRRDALTNAGGFAAAANVLAEDYLLGRAVAQAGYGVKVLGYPVRAVSRDRSPKRMLQRQMRWAQIRRHVAPAIFALEPLGYPLVWVMPLVVAHWLAASAIGLTASAPIPVIALLVASAIIQNAVALSLRGKSVGIIDLLALPLTPMLAILAWARAWGDDAIVWRQQRFRIGRGSQLVPLAPRVSRAAARLPEAA